MRPYDVIREGMECRDPHAVCVRPEEVDETLLDGGDTRLREGHDEEIIGTRVDGPQYIGSTEGEYLGLARAGSCDDHDGTIDSIYDATLGDMESCIGFVKTYIEGGGHRKECLISRVLYGFLGCNQRFIWGKWKIMEVSGHEL